MVNTCAVRGPLSDLIKHIGTLSGALCETSVEWVPRAALTNFVLPKESCAIIIK